MKTVSGVLRTIQIGDIVVLQEDGTARCLWKLAKVIKMISGRDGVVRATKVLLINKDKVTNLRHQI